MTTSDDSIPNATCSKCKRSLPPTREFFRADKRRKCGHASECRVCSREYSRSWKERNPDKKRAHDRDYQARNKSDIQQRRRKQRVANIEKVREQERERKQRHLQNNPGAWRNSAYRRRSRNANAICTFTAEHERFALSHFNGCCAVCERPLKDLFGTHTLAWDHWIPLSKGGHTTPNNMIPLCHGRGGCNNSKHDLMPEEWLNKRHTRNQVKQILARIDAYFKVVAG